MKDMADRLAGYYMGDFKKSITEPLGLLDFLNRESLGGIVPFKKGPEHE
jgi:hypothetical protein